MGEDMRTDSKYLLQVDLLYCDVFENRTVQMRSLCFSQGIIQADC